MENKQVEVKKVKPVLICEVVELDEDGKEVGGYAIMSDDAKEQ